MRRVNFIVEHTRVGPDDELRPLTLEIETDGTSTPQAALAQAAAEILVREFSRFAEIGRPSVATGDDVPAPVAANLLDAPIEELDLPMRAYNSLKRNNITKIGQLLALSDDELLRMRNFGKKSLDDMKERLALRGFIAPEDGTRSADESDLPAAAELDEAAAAELEPRGLAESMPHRIAGRKFSRATAHREHMLANLAVSVLRFEKLRTTEAKAKEVRGGVDHLIALAKRGDLSARRQLVAQTAQ